LLLIASLEMSGCLDSLHSQQLPAKWSTGFWIWDDHLSRQPLAPETVDVLFVHAGTINENGARRVYGELPSQLPKAREYWLVYRFERQHVPDLSAAPDLAKDFSELREEALGRHLHVAGIQLDIDSPTGSLEKYGTFLHAVRQGLPAGTGISITALLDWFRAGTAISSVIKEADEFVPQFYDLNNPVSYAGGPDNAVAAKIDAAQWGPVFNRFGKRFRIGASSFGRARLVPRENATTSGNQYYGISSFRDLTPLDIALNTAFQLQTSRNEAGELVLNYAASRKSRIGYNDFVPGDTVQFILPTPDAVRAAAENAKRMGRYCAGIVFFRWPTANESLALQPDVVLSATGSIPPKQQKAEIRLVDGDCVAVKCVDAYLLNAPPLAAESVRYRIRASKEMEYFLPEEKMPVKMVGPSELELSLPPYCGRGRMYLGRVVTAVSADFTVEEEP
jgi:hypothetical protein